MIRKTPSVSWPIFSLLLISLFVIFGCKTLTSLGDFDADPIANRDLDPDNTLRLLGGQPRTLDPALTHGGPDGPIGAIFSGLVNLDTDLQVQPDLAAGWTVSPDGLVYTFYLNPNARFHDGRPVTAADIIFAWERAVNPETGSDTAQTYLGDIVGVEDVLNGWADHITGLTALDENTLEVRIDEPKVYFLSKLTYPVAFVVDANNVVDPDWQREPNGTGPFKLQEWRDDEILLLARNEDYYRTPPAIGHILYSLGPALPLSEYELDEIDMVGVGGGSLERVQDPNNPMAPDLRVSADMCTNFVDFNTSQPPFDNPKVRQAFSYAIDRQRLIDGLFMGDALPANGPLPPGMPGYTPDLAGYDFDLEKAQMLLAEAGYTEPGSFPLVTYTTSGFGSPNPLVTALITMWAENLGVTVEPVLLEPYSYLDELYAGNKGNIFGYGWCADYPDPENFLDVLFHSDSAQNLSGYANPLVDEMLRAARVESDIASRMDQYAQIERLVVEDAPAVFLTHSLSAMLVKPRVQGYELTPIGVPQWQNITLTP